MARQGDPVIRQWLKKTFVRDMVLESRARTAIRQWERKGSPFPPPGPYKQMEIRDYARRFGLRSLLETGTYRGAMIEFQRTFFDSIVSIELDETLHKAAIERFRPFKHIRIVQGDSGEKLKDVTKEVNYPCLFWLDGHFSGGVTAQGTVDTPIMKELEHIYSMNRDDYIILIDDARDFGKAKDYPTVQEVVDLTKKRHPNWVCENRADIIRIHPRL